MGNGRLNKMQVTAIETPYGNLVTRWTERGLFSVDFPDAGQRPPHRGSESSTSAASCAGLYRLVQSYFAGLPVDFGEVPIDWSGYTPFQVAVLQVVFAIPHGQTLSYGLVAEQVGRPRTARAVGNAVGINRTPIVVPCHRVVRGDSSIGGFSGGAAWKERLLAVEGVRLYSSGKVAI
ncbi:MAG: methylated-DNA--[protein]-cysteine S-methyltransferase [Desulforudis sp.]|nr:MAG: methylated-DNA--[protein]-cysteine S-methyltransferase [Desulforudis sp.]